MVYDERVFRSRGVRYDLEKGTLTMKVYYEADRGILDGHNRLKEVSKELAYFEYSLDEGGKVDSVNFHTDFKSMACDLPGGQGPIGINMIRSIFNSSYRAYTVGYRLTDMQVAGRSLYYYPTIWKGNRYGLKGIEDKRLIHDQVSRFVKMLSLAEAETEIVTSFTALMTKFKGVCMTESNEGNLTYKLYGRIPNRELVHYFKKTIDVKGLNELYGDPVLSCIKIRHNKIVGYNLYYLQ